MVELDEIEGVGPSYAESLAENGYESAEAVARADPDEVDDVISTMSGEELVESAQEIAVEGDDKPDEEKNETASDSDDIITMEPGFNKDQRNHIVHALVLQEVMARRTNDPTKVEVVKDAIDEILDGEPYELTFDQITYAHNGLGEHETNLRSQRGIAGFISEIRNAQHAFREERTDFMNNRQE